MLTYQKLLLEHDIIANDYFINVPTFIRLIAELLKSPPKKKKKNVMVRAMHSFSMCDDIRMIIFFLLII